MNTLIPMLGDIQNALCDMIDIRNVLSEKTKKKPKDHEGTECTIGMCLDSVIETLEELEDMANEETNNEN